MNSGQKTLDPGKPLKGIYINLNAEKWMWRTNTFHANMYTFMYHVHEYIDYIYALPSDLEKLLFIVN